MRPSTVTFGSLKKLSSYLDSIEETSLRVSTVNLLLRMLVTNSASYNPVAKGMTDNADREGDPAT